jgi:hypothetical protein
MSNFNTRDVGRRTQRLFFRRERRCYLLRFDKIRRKMRHSLTNRVCLVQFPFLLQRMRKQ